MKEFNAVNELCLQFLNEINAVTTNIFQNYEIKQNLRHWRIAKKMKKNTHKILFFQRHGSFLNM